MKISKNILFLFLIFFINSCSFKSYVNSKNEGSYNNTNFGKFLAASYSVQNGDISFASSILTNKIDYSKDDKLVELAFFSKIINGDFIQANSLKKKYPFILDKSSFSLVPEIAINLKNKNFKKAIKLIDLSSDLPGFKNLKDKMNYIIKVLSSNNKQELNEIFNSIKNKDIYDILIFEDFLKNSNENFIDTFSKNSQTEVNSFLISGYFYRKNLIEKKMEFLSHNLGYDFDRKRIILNFKNQDNVFINKPSFLLLISSYISDLAIKYSQNKNIPSSYLKMLLEISNFIFPKLEFLNYYLSKIFIQENNQKLAIKKLELISKNSFAYLPSLIKKYQLYKNLDPKKSKNILDLLKKKFSKNTSVQYELADYYRKADQCSKAIKIYDKILVIHKNNFKFQFFKASCLEKLGLWEDAKKVFNKIINNNKDPYALNYLSYSMTIRDENLDIALKLILNALEKEPNNGFFLDTLGWVQYKNKEYKLAVKNLQRAVSIQPNSSEIMDHLGDCYLKMGRKKEALFEWKRALNFDASKKLKKILAKKIKLYESN